MDKSNRLEFLNVVGSQELRLPERVEQAVADPDVIAAYDWAFPEVGVYQLPYNALCELLQNKYDIGMNDIAERGLVFDLLRQKRMDDEIRRILNGEA